MQGFSEEGIVADSVGGWQEKEKGEEGGKIGIAA